jgi:hypothetical protein
MQSIGQAIYGQAGATSGDGATPSGDGAAEDSGESEEAGTIEGEFREV